MQELGMTVPINLERLNAYIVFAIAGFGVYCCSSSYGKKGSDHVPNLWVNWFFSSYFKD